MNLKKMYEYILKLLKIEDEGLFYISGSEKLPTPLTVEEEKDLLLRLAEGDDEARKKLVEKNIKLATYASRCIENEILMYLRKTQKLKTEISIDEPINTDAEGNDLALSDILGSESDNIFKQVEDSDNKKVIDLAIKNLDSREKVIMELRYGFDGKNELTQKEVADKLGISQSYISRIEKKVIERLKKQFNESK